MTASRSPPASSPRIPPKVRKGLKQFEVVRVHTASSNQPRRSQDWVAVEEPLEVRLAGDRWLTTMRTPGHDHELVTGLLLAEGIIGSRQDLGTIAHCGAWNDPGYGNVIDVSPAPGTVFAPETPSPARQHRTVTSACGVCGRDTVDDLLTRCRPLESQHLVSAATIHELLQSLTHTQHNFRLSGGVHAASLITVAGERVCAFEDVGRHNATDKAFGHWLLTEPCSNDELMLLVSGRVSFEIVQKAAVARCPVIAGVSAPSSLAVDTAERLHITLIGFARNQQLNVYTGTERIRELSTPT